MGEKVADSGTAGTVARMAIATFSATLFSRITLAPGPRCTGRRTAGQLTILRCHSRNGPSHTSRSDFHSAFRTDLCRAGRATDNRVGDVPPIGPMQAGRAGDNRTASGRSTSEGVPSSSPAPGGYREDATRRRQDHFADLCYAGRATDNRIGTSPITADLCIREGRRQPQGTPRA